MEHELTKHAFAGVVRGLGQGLMAGARKLPGQAKQGLEKLRANPLGTAKDHVMSNKLNYGLSGGLAYVGTRSANKAAANQTAQGM